jgi:alkaline phosphatase D
VSAGELELPDQKSGDQYGVASGDPSENGVTIWTRIPDFIRARMGLGNSASIEVRWWISEGSEGEPICKETNLVQASPERDFVLKIPVENLSPGCSYRYGFEIEGEWKSDTGFARTLPAQGDELLEMKFAYVSCQNYGTGFYTVFQALAQDNVDFCVHLGDSIYERVSERDRFFQVRPDSETEARTLAEYRERYKLVLSDPWFREVRRRFTWICLPDDHEVMNDYYGSDPKQEARRRDALQAYFEYTPLADVHFPAVHRTFRFGKLATLFALDERQYRDGQACANNYLKPQCDASNAPGRTLLGKRQKSWFKEGILGSDSHWNILLSQVMFMPQRVIDRPDFLRPDAREETLHHFPVRKLEQDKWVANRKKADVYVSLDSWDGFPAERSEILDMLASRGQGNTLVWTGDIHNSYGGWLQYGGRNVGYELSTGSISSYGVGDIFRFGTAKLLEPLIRRANRHMTTVDLRHHMYVRVTLTPHNAQFETVCPATIFRPLAPFSVVTCQNVKHGSLEVQC